jgi:transposase
VKASVKHNKNDATDAAAICEAVTLILIGFLFAQARA